MSRLAWGFFALIAVAALCATTWHFATQPPTRVEFGPGHPVTVSSVSVCRICGSHKSETRSVEDSDGPVLDSDASPAYADTDVLVGRHEHLWALSHFNAYDADGDLVSHGDAFPLREGRTPNSFTAKYNGNSSYRAFIKKRLAAGTMSDAELVPVILLESLEGESAAARRGRELLEEFTSGPSR